MKQSFNETGCYKTREKENAFAVTLPHDAMQLDERRRPSAGGVNIGCEAQDYTYEKTFIPSEKARKTKSDPEFEAFTVRQLYISTAKKLHIILMAISSFL